MRVGHFWSEDKGCIQNGKTTGGLRWSITQNCICVSVTYLGSPACRRLVLQRPSPTACVSTAMPRSAWRSPPRICWHAVTAVAWGKMQKCVKCFITWERKKVGSEPLWCWCIVVVRDGENTENILLCSLLRCNGGYPSAAWDFWTKDGLVSGGLYDSHVGEFSVREAPTVVHICGVFNSDSLFVYRLSSLHHRPLRTPCEWQQTPLHRRRWRHTPVHLPVWSWIHTKL